MLYITFTSLFLCGISDVDNNVNNLLIRCIIDASRDVNEGHSVTHEPSSCSSGCG